MPAPLLVAIGIAALAPSVFAGIGQVWPPFAEGVKHTAFNLTPNKLPTITELAMMRVREAITEVEYFDKAKQEGFNTEEATNFYTISYQLLTAYDYITLWRREKLTENNLDTKLSKLGLFEDDITNIKNATEFFPAPQDLIRFAVREVYTPEIANAFGIFNEFPQEFAIEAKKAGVTEEQAKNYWGSHWVLPSVNMGFEMLHRRIINPEQTSQLLKALDIMPYWRDMLIQLSYNPLTRVDVRRMYRTGTLSEEEVYNAYLDVGYSPENATRLLDFTMKYENEDRLGLTRSSILTAYKRGIIDDSALQTNLEALGYSESTVSFWLSMSAFDKEMEELKLVEKTLKAQFKAGHIDINQVRSALSAYDVPAIYIDEVVAKIAISINERLARPTKADLLKWLAGEVIDISFFTSRMLQLGYKEADINLYIVASEG